MKNPLILIIIFIGIIIGGVYWIFEPGERERTGNSDVEVVNTWKLPNKLMEISGIAFVKENRIACIQDEEGTIFIYNTSSSEIEREIPFGKNGDYEGIAVVGENVYVLRSDGTLFEIIDFLHSEKPEVNEYDTPLNDDQNLEGLCHDPNKNRLLLVMKEGDQENRDYKEVFEFDLATKKLNTSPVYELKMSATTDDEKFRPSEIGIDSSDGKMYILTAKNPRFIEFEKGTPTKIYTLDKHIFPQPEGLTFGPDGKIFISTEGVPGKILQVTLKEK